MQLKFDQFTIEGTPLEIAEFIIEKLEIIFAPSILKCVKGGIKMTFITLFNENMTYEEMDRMIRKLEEKYDFNFHKVANELSKSDINMYIKAYCEKFKLEESDLSNNKKAPESIFIYSTFLYKL